MLTENLSFIRSNIETAARRVGRDPVQIKLVAVSKTHPADVVREGIAAGLIFFGENKVQEAESKILEIGGDEVEWHLIGHLQSNKARRAVQLFDVIQSLDSIELAKRLERICIEESREMLPVLIQVDLAGESTRSGVAETRLVQLVEFVGSCKCLRLDGLMILPPYFDDPESARPYFRRLCNIRDDLAGSGAFADRPGELSMGMTNDFEVAIEEGATIVRIGTAIFGQRGRPA